MCPLSSSHLQYAHPVSLGIRAQCSSRYVSRCSVLANRVSVAVPGINPSQVMLYLA